MKQVCFSCLSMPILLFFSSGISLTLPCLKCCKAEFKSILDIEQCSAHSNISGLSGNLLLNIFLGGERVSIGMTLFPFMILVSSGLLLRQKPPIPFTSLLSCGRHDRAIPKYGSAYETLD